MFKMKPSSPVVIYSYLMHHKTLQRKEAQSSTTSPTVDTSEVSLIQEGIVRKHGFRLNHWKIKGYSIYSNRRLIFYHVDGMESTRKASVRENSFILNGNLFTQLKYVYCRSGDESHIDASGAADYSSEHGVAIDILCSDSVDEYADICTEIGNNRSVVQLLASLSNSTTCIQLVFDTANAAKSFLEAITKISLKNNVQSFAKSLGWAVEIDPETLTAFAEMNEEVRVREEQVASGKCIEEVKEEVQQVVKEDEVEGSATLRTASINSTSTTATASSRRVSGRFVEIATKTVNAAGSMASGTVNAAGRVGMISATAVLDSVKDKSVVKEGVDTVRVIGEGVFIKQGSNVKSWKTRKYVLTSDHVLWYYDMSGNVLKGSVTVKNIRVGDGSPDAIRSCGLNSTLQAAAVGIGIKSMTDNRVLEVVLHTPNDAKLFLRQLVEASLHNNIPVSFVLPFLWMYSCILHF